LKTSIRLEPLLDQRISIIAEQSGQSKSEVIRLAIERGLEPDKSSHKIDWLRLAMIVEFINLACDKLVCDADTKEYAGELLDLAIERGKIYHG
jgi:metal-responsive CopG/Arc/MetJ family transcriptional regulator